MTTSVEIKNLGPQHVLVEALNKEGNRILAVTLVPTAFTNLYVYSDQHIKIREIHYEHKTTQV